MISKDKAIITAIGAISGFPETLVSAAASQARIAFNQISNQQLRSFDQGQIIKLLQTTALLVADVSTGNPGVTEVIRVAISMNVPLMIISKNSAIIPSDLSNYPKYTYDPSSPAESVNRLKSMLVQFVELPSNFRGNVASPGSPLAKKVFISYSKSDTEFLQRLQIHLKPLERIGLIDVWVDTYLRAGDQWESEIKVAIANASAAILLISADFLASDFITQNELPPILQNAADKGVRILPLILKPCRFSRDENFQKFQAINDPLTPLITMDLGSQERLYDQVAQEVELILDSGSNRDRELDDILAQENNRASL